VLLPSERMLDDRKHAASSSVHRLLARPSEMTTRRVDHALQRYELDDSLKWRRWRDATSSRTPERHLPARLVVDSDFTFLNERWRALRMRVTGSFSAR